MKCPSMACDRDPGPKMSGPGGSVMRDQTNGRNSTVIQQQQKKKICCLPVGEDSMNNNCDL